MHEASLYPRNCFLTLTYSDEHLPANNSLYYPHFQLFLKRLRKHFNTKTIRFYMCGEYGTSTSRPHYHACIFNLHFTDQKHWRKTDTNNFIFHSPTLTKLWPYGQHSIGELNSQTASYTARYIMAKITGDQAQSHYGGRMPEFNRMSLRPGIGSGWFQRNHRDIFPHDYLVVDGTKTGVPKYYSLLYERIDPGEYSEVKATREFKASFHAADNTTERLAVKAIVTDARVSQLKRTL